MMLLTWNNLAYYQALMRDMRAAIAVGAFEAFREVTKERWAKGEADRRQERAD